MSNRALRWDFQRNEQTEGSYDHFAKIDGSHPFQEKVPGGYILYAVRKRHGGRVLYFNFALAKEMGLIPEAHPEELNTELAEILLDTFAIQIINEYDLQHKTRIPKEDIKPKRYMATRYLQLQHPSRTGRTSGDGRSIWNGVWKGKGATWDITSCGTGATSLSPATAIFGRYFKTGEKNISYGCGYCDLEDGIETAIFSDILRRNQVHTERTLAIIEFPGNLSINVRAGKNLLRPSHFFNHLKQKNYLSLKGAIDLFIQRQLGNNEWAPLASGENPYHRMLTEMAKTFATMAARFESEYIFCWLAWDGDNILADGGIIDYGSVRQFGLYHHEYRFDDTDRWSTNLKEQRRVARYIVQTFAQITDYLNTGYKRSVDNFKSSRALKLFDQVFDNTKKTLLLHKIGFSEEQAKILMICHPRLVEKFQREFSYFETKVSSRPPARVADGITRDTLFCMRDFLRELPRQLLSKRSVFTPQEFVDLVRSDYASHKDVRLTSNRRRHIDRLQSHYLRLLKEVCGEFKMEPNDLLMQMNERAKVINRYERITGDSICHVGEKLMRARKKLTSKAFHRVLESFVQNQVLDPDQKRKHTLQLTDQNIHKILKDLQKIIEEHRQSL